jgi:hypothetical protein
MEEFTRDCGLAWVQAAWRHRPRLVKFLVEQARLDKDEVDGAGMTPLLLACCKCHWPSGNATAIARKIETIRYLIEDTKCGIYARDNSGNDAEALLGPQNHDSVYPWLAPHLAADRDRILPIPSHGGQKGGLLSRC